MDMVKTYYIKYFFYIIIMSTNVIYLGNGIYYSNGKYVFTKPTSQSAITVNGGITGQNYSISTDGNASFSGNVSVADEPTLPDHLTNKTYVDGLIATVGGGTDLKITSLGIGTSPLYDKFNVDTNGNTTIDGLLTLGGQINMVTSPTA